MNYQLLTDVGELRGHGVGNVDHKIFNRVKLYVALAVRFSFSTKSCSIIARTSDDLFLFSFSLIPNRHVRLLAATIENRNRSADAGGEDFDSQMLFVG